MCTGEKKNANRVRLGKSEGKRPTDILRQKWKDIIKIYFTEKNGVEWT